MIMPERGPFSVFNSWYKLDGISITGSEEFMVQLSVIKIAAAIQNEICSGLSDPVSRRGEIFTQVH